MTDLVAHQQTLRVDRFADGAEFRDFFKANYGPTIAVYRFIADDPAKVDALDADLAALGDRFLARRRHGLGVPAGDRSPGLTPATARRRLRSTAPRQGDIAMHAFTRGHLRDQTSSAGTPPSATPS